jgi:hypothetical protein
VILWQELQKKEATDEIEENPDGRKEDTEANLSCGLCRVREE